MSVHLLDVNILLAILDSSHVHHKLCTRWFLRTGSRGWALCPITENGFIRVITQPSYPNFRVTPSIASGLLRGLQQGFAETFSYFSADIRLSDSTLFALDRITSSKQLTDLYLAGLAFSKDARLATLDAGIHWQAVQGATENLVTVITSPNLPTRH